MDIISKYQNFLFILFIIIQGVTEKSGTNSEGFYLININLLKIWLPPPPPSNYI
jgi:hypothetical protein